MNILKWLTSRRGAVSRAGAVGALATAGLVGINMYGYLTDTPKAQEPRVRALSSIISQGGEIPSEYASAIQVRGNNRLATADERAALEGTISFDAVIEQENAIDAMNFSAPSGAAGVPGVYGTVAGENGLGMGANAATMLGPDGKPMSGHGGPATGAAGVDQVVAEQGGTKINKLGETPEGGLQRASITRVNAGNGSGGAFSNSTMGSGAGSSALAERNRHIGASSLSGAMPGGSMLVSASGALQGARSASFVPSDREAHMGRGDMSGQMSSLRGIAKASNKVAANANRSANEHDQIFMGGDRLSGGVTVDDGTTVDSLGGTSYSEGDDSLDNKVQGMDVAMDDVDTSEAERKAHRSRLQQMLFGLLAATFVGMIAIQALVESNTVWSWIGAAVVAAILVVAIGFFIADAAKYISKYSSDGWSIASLIAGPIMLAGIGLAFAKKTNSWLKPVGKFLTKNMAMQLLSGTILGSLTTMGVSSTVESIKAQTGGDDSTGLKND